MSQDKPPVAFLGLGAMGFGMSTNLVKEGFQVTGFDVWGPTLDRFKAAGGLTAATPAEAVSGKDYCICMVATAQQAQQVLIEGDNPATDGLAQGASVLLCSTVPCSYVQGLEQELQKRGRGDIQLVDCPVSGGTTRAASGNLSIMASGPEVAMQKGSIFLKAMSDPKKLYIVDGGVGAGSNMKMCHQVLAAVHILASSEAMGFASCLGLELKEASEKIMESEGSSWMLGDRLPRILSPDHTPIASANTIILKDASIITKEARRYGFPTPMTSAAEQAYFVAINNGWGRDDDGSLIRLYNQGREKVGPIQATVDSKEEKLSLVIDLLRAIYLCATAEALSFAHRVGLDLDQTLDLCANAAGGSKVFAATGAAIANVLRGQSSLTDAAGNTGPSLQTFATKLSAAVEEAQNIKTPLFLGTTALALLRMALSKGDGGGNEVPAKAAVGIWI